MAASDCIKVIEDAAAGRLTDDEIEELVEELNRARAESQATDDLFDLERTLFNKAQEIASDVDLAAKIEKRNRLINIRKRAALMQDAAAADRQFRDPSLALEAAMVGVNAPLEGGRRSVDAVAQGIMRSYMGGMVHDMKSEGVLRLWNSAELEREVARELWDLSLPEPTGKVTDSADAKTLARIVHKYQRAAVARENRAGAYIRYRKGYVTRQSHDPHRMIRAGYDEWAKDIQGRLDWDEMNVEAKDRSDFLQSAYDALVTGVRKNGPENDLLFAFKGPGNLAKKDSAGRTLLFKSPDDWFDYDQRFGKRSLNEAIRGDLERSAQATALMDRFGTNPQAMLDRVRDDLKKKYRSDEKKVKRIGRRSLDWQMQEIDGSVNFAANHTAAAVGRNIRAVQSMAKLGGAFISSVTDVATAMAQKRVSGYSIGKAVTDGVMAPIQGFGRSKDQQRVAELIGVGLDGVMGDFTARFSAQDQVTGKVAKAQSLFFKLNLLGPWTDAVKRGVGLITARDLAMDAKLPFERLPELRQVELARYGFNAEKWNVARKAVAKAEDGREYIFPAAIRDLPDSAFGKKKGLKDEITESLFALFADVTDTASPTPGARTRAILRQGSQPGTFYGESIRFVTQFKSFPIAVNEKITGRFLYGRGATSLSDAILRGEGDLMGLASFIALGTVLGLSALQAKEVAKGRQPREINQSTITAAMLQGGGLGIYGDFLLGETNRFGASLLDTLAGPTIGTLADVDKIRAKIIAGDSYGGDVIRVLQSNIPGANLFYVKAALDYMIVYRLQEMASPGYLRRMERRMKRDNNQEFFLPPSRTVPMGGGL